MIRALRSVTVERGRDPSDFMLCAFGGNGPVHAAHIARAMDIGTIIVPPCPGLFSAFGLLLADLEQHYSRTVRRPLDKIALPDLENMINEMAEQAKAGARDPEYPIAKYTLERSLVLRFVGQTTGLPVAIPAGKLSKESLEAATKAFLDEYHKTYGFESPGETIEVEALRMVAKGDSMASRTWLKSAARADADIEIRSHSRSAYFGAPFGRLETPILSRAELETTPRQGPIIIEGYDATTVIPPDCTAKLDQHSNIIITIGM
jgi:N-methylhydantoinase A